MSKKYKIAIPEMPIDRSELPTWVLEECELLEGEKGQRGGNEVLMKDIADVDAIIFNSSNNITPELMQMAPNLKIVFKSGAWPENVDFDYAKSHNIAVGWTPTANSQSVAEFTVLLMLAAEKKFIHAVESFREGAWRNQSHLGHDLYGKVVGLVGLGNIARVVAATLKALGSQVIAYDPYLTDEVFAELGVERVTFDELLDKSDIVSIHCLLTDETRHMFNRETFAKMKDSAILVNIARGGMVDEPALIEALNSGKLRGAALDVHAVEPPPMDDPLRTMENVIMTPHVAARTYEAAYRECAWAIMGCLDYLHGRPIHDAKVVFPD